MFRSIFTISFLFTLTLFLSVTAFSQSDITSPDGRSNPQKEDLPKNIKENLAKQRIAREKKDYQELLDRSQEAVKLSEELEKSFADSSRITADDEKKLDRLEKLLKKIRTELGAGDDGDLNNEEFDKIDKSAGLINAFKILQTSSAQLFDEIKKSTRYSVSVVAVQTSNALLKLVKFIRFGK